jgi:hypothetical protein
LRGFQHGIVVGVPQKASRHAPSGRHGP